MTADSSTVRDTMRAAVLRDYDKDLVTRRFSLDDAAVGYEALRQRAVQGRAVVDMSL